MKTYTVKIEGKNPLIVHADDVEWADKMEEWNKSPKNKKEGKAGDDRSPAWRWIGFCYNDGKILTIPSENIMACLLGAGAKIPTGKKTGTFKSLSQTGLACLQFHWPLLVNGATISWSAIQNLMSEESFRVQAQTVKELGFELFVKPAVVQGKRHIRVRPRFKNWSTEGKIMVSDDSITKTVVQQLFEIGGELFGLGDWRPGAPKKPGQYGTFKAEIK